VKAAFSSVVARGSTDVPRVSDAPRPSSPAFGFGLGFGFGSGLWITTGASFGGSGTAQVLAPVQPPAVAAEGNLRRFKIRWRDHRHGNRLRGRWHFNNLMNRGIQQTRHNGTVNHDRKQRRPGKRRGKSRVIEVIVINVKKPNPDFKCK
jgi:hypothetical protein